MGEAFFKVAHYRASLFGSKDEGLASYLHRIERAMQTTSTAVWQSDSTDRISNPATVRASIPVPGSSTQESEQGSSRRLWTISFAVWTLLAFFSVAGSSAYYVIAGGRAPAWGFLFGASFTDAYTWALLTPLIYWLSRRYSFDLQGWKPAAVFHSASVIFFAIGAALATSGLNWLTGLIRGGTPIPFRSEVVSLALENLPRYCLVVAVTQAVLYHERLQARRIQASQLEAQLVQAQLQALKMQLQPHFLFNVLNSIATLSRRDPLAAETMTLQVAELLRLTLQSADLHQVPLRRELEFLDCYFRIQQTRFQDRLRVRFDVPSSIMDAAIPPLLLQPLVENAIRHGISPLTAGGCITLRAQRHETWLDLEILDNGVGLSSSREGLRQEGIGLKNTRARLCQLYGQRFDFACENVQDGGCRVRVRLPFVRVESAAKNGAAN